MTVEQAWRARVDSEELTHDPEQERVVGILQELQDRIRATHRGLPRIRRWLGIESDAVRGLWLWGGVGRGKTFLMDLFYETLRLEARRRVHFHRLMSEVHRRRRALRHVEDPLDRVAGDIARDVRVLCFDEFFVSDIGDAMILGRLLEGLFRRGVLVVATSNVPPDDLYRNGLQRERFLPAIARLEENMEVVELAGGTDYRLQLLQSAGTWLVPANESAEGKLERYFHDIAAGSIEESAEVEIAGRTICSRRRAPGIVWFDFGELCEGPRSQEDYIEIARGYPTVIVSAVPGLTAADDDAARRFISLVDELYDRRVKLLVTAETPIEGLYAGRRLAFEFQRTSSRLIEMQSTEYLHAAHLS